MINRRIFMYGIGMVLSDSAIAPWARAQDSINRDGLIFFAGRSGRFKQNGGKSQIMIGGLLVPLNLSIQLEAELEALARITQFTIPLRFSTNHHNQKYYENAISIIFRKNSAIYSGVRLWYSGWPSERVVREYWRQNAETSALTAIARDKPLLICSLRHGRGADNRIYASISKALPPSSNFKIYDSDNVSPRVMQVSNLLTKCLNSERQKGPDSPNTMSGNKHKNSLVRSTYKAFGLNELGDKDIQNDFAVIRNINA